jgi:hypothetical protein
MDQVSQSGCPWQAFQALCLRVMAGVRWRGRSGLTREQYLGWKGLSGTSTRLIGPFTNYGCKSFMTWALELIMYIFSITDVAKYSEKFVPNIFY